MEHKKDFGDHFLALLLGVFSIVGKILSLFFSALGSTNFDDEDTDVATSISPLHTHLPENIHHESLYKK